MTPSEASMQFIQNTDAARAPNRGDWGVLCYGDQHQVMGGGSPVFLWFNNPRDLASYLRTHHAHFNGDRDQIDEAVLADIKAAVDAWEKGLKTPYDACDVLNEHLAGYLITEWFGSYETLAWARGEIESRTMTQFLSAREYGVDWVDMFDPENAALEAEFRKAVAEWE